MCHDKLLQLGWTEDRFVEYCRLEEKRQSENAGISRAYLVSQEFKDLAQQMSGLDDPCFYDLQDVFFAGDRAIGRDTPCPRDGRPGCALVDYLPKKYKGECTCYLSWTWSTKLSVFQSSLAILAEQIA